VNSLLLREKARRERGEEADEAPDKHVL